MTARGTDWGLAALVASLIATGALTLFEGSSRDAWVFASHDALGAAIALLVVVKLGRIWPRLRNRRRWDNRTWAGIGAIVLVIATLVAGWLWSAGANAPMAGYSLLAWHDALGAVLAVLVVAHMVLRAKPLRGANRRFTGSYEAGSFQGNAFPTTSWVADKPRPIALDGYRLRVTGLVQSELELQLAELPARDEVVATLDCTGGFYSTQRWRGNMLSRILEQASVDVGRARHVSVVSQTGYRWSFSLDDASRLLLATHVGDEALSHSHGAPIRLVAPGSRGFQWVKWVHRIELLEDIDYGAPASTVWSSFTRAGRGDA